MSETYLGVAVSIKGTVFAHPGDGSPGARAADQAARARGDYPYAHLYEGDNIEATVAEMQDERDLAHEADMRLDCMDE